jgi:hypothetical protein
MFAQEADTPPPSAGDIFLPLTEIANDKALFGARRALRVHERDN